MMRTGMLPGATLSGDTRSNLACIFKTTHILLAELQGWYYIGDDILCST
jgi:hypothetical protein